ncbi:hypothetical protein K439DRAFT_411414 [Ramaria rubella]|nr:hypothetical protein K439DRAFT_411414 [Ramaria rubella]
MTRMRRLFRESRGVGTHRRTHQRTPKRTPITSRRLVRGALSLVCVDASECGVFGLCVGFVVLHPRTRILAADITARADLNTPHRLPRRHARLLRAASWLWGALLGQGARRMGVIRGGGLGLVLGLGTDMGMGMVWVGLRGLLCEMLLEFWIFGF